MPRKVRELEAELAREGFVRRSGKGSHRRWEHPVGPGNTVTIAGQAGADAAPYQERQVREAIRKAKEAQR